MDMISNVRLTLTRIFVHIILAKYVVQSFNVDIENLLVRSHSHVYFHTLFIKASYFCLL